MSAELFAAFGDVKQDHDASLPASTRPQPLSGVTTRHLDDSSHNPVAEQESASAADDFDDFGDFESAGQDVSYGHLTPPDQTRLAVSPGPGSARTQASTKLAARHPGKPEFPRGSLTREPRDPNVLFDAEDPEEALWEAAAENGSLDGGDSDQDGFGDFEDASAVQKNTVAKQIPVVVPQSSATRNRHAMNDLLDLYADPPAETRTSHPLDMQSKGGLSTRSKS